MSKLFCGSSAKEEDSRKLLITCGVKIGFMVSVFGDVACNKVSLRSNYQKKRSNKKFRD
jgi:hypothetical protein